MRRGRSYRSLELAALKLREHLFPELRPVQRLSATW